jgi:hypothetical protein
MGPTGGLNAIEKRKKNLTLAGNRSHDRGNIPELTSISSF